MKYKKRRKYKYNLRSDENFQTSIQGVSIDLRFLKINSDGKLFIRNGYSWDGPSGPTIDTRNFMRGSLAHDALYQLLREKVLKSDCRKEADKVLKDICIKDGMWKVRATWVYWAVRLFGGEAAKPDMRTAP